MATRLRDTVVLVTGASSGIGSATARPLAAEGAAMALVARRRDRLEQVAETITDAGRSALILDADLTDADQAAEGLTRAVDELGRLDVVVNNAGLLYVGTIADAWPGEWERMIAIDVDRRCSCHPRRTAPPRRRCVGEDQPVDASSRT